MCDILQFLGFFFFLFFEGGLKRHSGGAIGQKLFSAADYFVFSCMSLCGCQICNGPVCGSVFFHVCVPLEPHLFQHVCTCGEVSTQGWKGRGFRAV